VEDQSHGASDFKQELEASATRPEFHGRGYSPAWTAPREVARPQPPRVRKGHAFPLECCRAGRSAGVFLQMRGVERPESKKALSGESSLAQTSVICVATKQDVRLVDQ
jgi:hypothetical protein